MRVLVYSLNYAPEPTSTGKYTGEMAAWLASRGHQVEVICGLPHYPEWKVAAAYANAPPRAELMEGVKVSRASHFVPSIQAVNARGRIRLETSFTLSAARYWLPRFFKRSTPDVVIAIMPPLQIGIWPLVFRWLRRVPWVLHVQDLQVDAALRLNMLKAERLGRLLYRVEGFMLRRATRVSTISEAMRQRIIAKGTPENRTWLLPNWSDLEAVRPSARSNGFRHSLGISNDTLIVLYAGNMGEKQGLDVVLQAADFCRNDPRLIFLMVGGGAAQPRLECKAAGLVLPNLRFLPVQPREKLCEMLAAADIHLVVQRHDAADLVMPSKLTNILAAGRACIVTAAPGTALYEVVHGHDTGDVVAPGDAAALANAIRRLATDAGRREACGQRARAYAERYLDKDRILAAFEQQLSALCT